VTVRRRPPRLVVLALAAAIVLPACEATPPAAEVGRSRISQSDLQTHLDVLLAIQPQLATQFQGPGGEDQRKSQTRRLLAFLIQHRVAATYAAEHGVKVDPADVTAQIHQIIQQEGGRGPYEKSLAALHITEEDLRRAVQESLLIGAVANALATRAPGQSADQAYLAWLRGQLKTTRVEVNPRFGRIDAATGGVEAITSTAG
jgi:SurA N-terminal domain